MNFLNSKNTLRLASFIVLLSISSFTFGQGTNGPTSPGYTLESCYHLLSPSNTGKTLNVLNTGTFHFNYTNNAGARPDHIRIKMYDAMHGFLGYNYQSIGIADNVFPAFYHPYFGELITVTANDEVNNNLTFNTNPINFPPEAALVEITTYHWTGDAGSQTLDENNYKMTLNLLDVNDAFTLNSGDKDCFTFDDFLVDISHSLDGFCGNIINTEIESKPPFPDGSGWDDTYNEPIVLGVSTSLSQPVNDEGKTWCEQDVNTQTADWNLPDPVPSGCLEFNFKFKITPCNAADANCPDIELAIPITICCSCDVRPVGPQQ